MNLYLRLLLLLLRIWRLPRRGVLDESRAAFHVLPNDCDINFHMNNGRYLSFMDLGRVHLMEQSGLLPVILKQGWMPVLSAADIVALQMGVRAVPVSDHLVRYALALVRQTRTGEPGVPDFVSDQLVWGAGPRAVQFLIVGAKARAVLRGRSHVAAEDIRALAPPVLRHRIVVGFTAESEGVTPDAIIERIVDGTPTHEDALARDPRFQTIFAS